MECCYGIFYVNNSNSNNSFNTFKFFKILSISQSGSKFKELILKNEHKRFKCERILQNSGSMVQPGIIAGSSYGDDQERVIRKMKNNWSDDPQKRPADLGSNPSAPTISIYVIKMKVKLIASLLAIAIGLIFYIGWGINYGVWADIGIYSVSVFFIGLGVLGTILYKLEEKES